MHFSHLIMTNAGEQRKKKPEVIGDEVSVYAENFSLFCKYWLYQDKAFLVCKLVSERRHRLHREQPHTGSPRLC